MNHLMQDSSDTDAFSGQEEFAVEIAAIQPRLYGFILKRLADREQTLEVLQRTNLVICRKANEFREGSSFAAWAFTIAKFQVMAWRKSASANRLVFSDRVYDLLNQTPSKEADAIDARIPLLRKCLEHLRDHDRQLIRRRYRDGEKIAPLAQSLDKSVDAITMRLSRIRRQLADCVQMELNQELQP